MGKTTKTAATNAAPALNVQIKTGIESGPIEAPSYANQFTFTDAASKFIRPVSLSEAGKKYIDTLIEKFASLPPNAGLRIKVETVPNLVEIRAIIDEVTHTYIILYFNESMKDFRELPVKRKEMPEVKVFAKRSEAMEAVVGSRSAREIQIMDPSTYETIDIRVPEYSEIGETVSVIRIDDVLYYVPELK